MNLVRNRSVARFVAFTTGVLTAALVVFHAALFYQRIADATIANAGVLSRWIGSFALLAAFFIGRRKLTGAVARRHLTLTFWLIVLLLHAAIPANETILKPADLAATLELTFVLTPALLLLAIAHVAADQQSRIGWVTNARTVVLRSRRDRRHPPRSPPV